MGIVLAAITSAGLLAGCAGVPLDAGHDASRRLVQARVPAGYLVQGEIDRWLAQPLGLEAAVRVALLRNPGLLASEAELGFGAADVFEAGRLHNPAVGLALLMPRGDVAGNKLSASVAFDFSGLLLRRSTKRIAESVFEATQSRVAADVLSVVSGTQRAWVDAVAAAQRVAVRESILEVADTAATLAARHAEAGNLPKLDLAIQQAAATEARLSLQQATADFVDARAALQQWLGLDAAASWTLPTALPMPDAPAVPDFAPLRERARAERLDLVAARKALDARSRAYATQRRTPLLARVDVGAELDREPDGARRAGPSLSLELPLFEQGQGRVARAAAELQRAQANLRALEVAVDAELQQQLQKLSLAQARAEGYRQALIPQREAVVARLQERVNYMLDDGFTLLLARQQEYAAYDGYVDAVQAFWHARVELLRASGTQLVAALPGDAP